MNKPYGTAGSVRATRLEPCWEPGWRSGTTRSSPFRDFKTSPEIIRLAVMICIRIPLSLRNVEDLLHERGIDICHEPVPQIASSHIFQWLTPQRRFDRSRVPSATCPHESILPIRLRPDFLVVFEGYAGWAEHWRLRQKARKRSLRASILWT